MAVTHKSDRMAASHPMSSFAAGRRLMRFTVVLAAAAIFMACQGQDLEKGRVCLNLGDYPMALRFFSQAVEKNPEGYEARLGFGRALLQKAAAENDSASWSYALIQLEACRSLDPSQDLDGLLAEAYSEKARSLLARRDTVEALSALSRAIERDPGNPQPVNLAGIVYGKLGEGGKAEALFRKALQLDSGDASAHFNLGMILWQNGDASGAHGHWFKALQAMPGDEDVLYWFALSEKKLRGSP